jgi:hypothetical protein
VPGPGTKDAKQPRCAHPSPAGQQAPHGSVDPRCPLKLLIMRPLGDLLPGGQSSINALRAMVHGYPPELVPLLLPRLPLAALFPLPGRRPTADSLLHPRSSAGSDPQSCLDRNLRALFNPAPLKFCASGDVPLICRSPEVARISQLAYWLGRIPALAVAVRAHGKARIGHPARNNQLRSMNLSLPGFIAVGGPGRCAPATPASLR